MAARPNRYSLGRYFGPPNKVSKLDLRKVFEYWHDTVLNQPEDQINRVTKVTHNLFQNSLEHHTDKYEPRYFVVRRGQPFVLDIELTQEYKEDKDDLRLVFQFGKDPKISKRSDVQLPLSGKMNTKGWAVKVESKEEKTIKVRVTTPANCYVGKWTLVVDNVKEVGGSVEVHRYMHEPKIYILFNPWCEDDTVYMAEADRRKEYVLNESGKIYVGSGWWPSPREWVFGQFEDIVLDCAIYLLDERSNMKDTVRGNPVNVTRKLSALVNSQDDSGVLTGNWSGDYEGGTSPLKWNGSVAILNEFYRDKLPVKYGQCWVFSGVVTTLCRAIGIPARSVTNFSSAHDTDGSITIDKFFDEDGEELEHMNRDSVWNFHVWNDVWMKRLDLPDGYEGWQAIDATPQETSDGIYCMGPMPLKAIREGSVTLPYDGPFVFAEVNGDRISWEVKKDGTCTFIECKENSVGISISTKKPNSDEREDVTHEYKHQEWGRRNRDAVRKAITHAKRIDEENWNVRLAEDKPKDVSVELRLPEQTPVGEPFKVRLEVKNSSNEIRKLGGRIHVSSQFNTGIVYRNIQTVPVDKELQAKQESTIDLEIPVDKYYKHLTDCCEVKVTCFIKVRETGQALAREEVVDLSKPKLTIKASNKCVLGETVNVEVSFTNPLDMTMTDCELWVEGPGLQRPLVLKQKNVAAKGTFVGKFPITPVKPGKRTLSVNFNSDQLLAIDTCHEIMVEK